MCGERESAGHGKHIKQIDRQLTGHAKPQTAEVENDVGQFTRGKLETTNACADSLSQRQRLAGVVDRGAICGTYVDGELDVIGADIKHVLKTRKAHGTGPRKRRNPLPGWVEQIDRYCNAEIRVVKTEADPFEPGKEGKISYRKGKEAYGGRTAVVERNGDEALNDVELKLEVEQIECLNPQHPGQLRER